MYKYLVFPKLNPVIFKFSFISLRWYGVMYLIGFSFALWIAKNRVIKLNLDVEKIKNLLYIIFIGVIFGGHIGYILFYNTTLFINDPLCILKIWNGGMSFHGGLIGVICVMLWFSYKNNINFFKISDFIAPLVPFGLGFGRLGNFINDELWGRIAVNVPWAMLFPNSHELDVSLSINNSEYQNIINSNIYKVLPRHPSQIYELLLEGVVLFFIINIFTRKKRPYGSVSGLFLFFYGIFRIFVEFFRQPDQNLGLFLHNRISMGQILSIPMVLFGIVIFLGSYYYKKTE